jgi:hypothetical protein
MNRDSTAPTWLRRAGLCAAIIAFAAFVEPAASQTVARASVGTARIWFYRDYEPSVSMNVANVALNGAFAGSVQADGSAFYRDVPAGHYHITVESFGADVNQAKDVNLAPGQEAYVKVLAGEWIGGGDRTSFRRDTFYISLVPPQLARAELPSHPLRGG